MVLDGDLARARRTARDFPRGYLAMPNYTASLARAGFTEDYFRGGAATAWLTRCSRSERLKPSPRGSRRCSKPARITWPCR